MIDLRSDTVTKPTKDMLEAMMMAKVGDDVFEEDPSVNFLEEKAAKMLGKQAALFCPSGTMTNQIALKIKTNPGEEIICDRLSHIYNYESGGIAFNSACSVRLLNGENGCFEANEVEKNINEDDIHLPVTSLVAVENTCNKGGGSIYNLKSIKEIALVCAKKSLSFHLDGARVFNAIVASKTSLKQLAKYFDTISICLSKGLGAPVGSLLLGTKKDIKKAKRIRKVFGGGMRQAGYLASAGIYALENHINRLELDHHRAKSLADLLKSSSFVEEVLVPQTNIVIFTVNGDAKKWASKLTSKGLACFNVDDSRIRMVTHLDFTDNCLQKAKDILSKIN